MLGSWKAEITGLRDFTWRLSPKATRFLPLASGRGPAPRPEGPASRRRRCHLSRRKMQKPGFSATPLRFDAGDGTLGGVRRGAPPHRRARHVPRGRSGPATRVARGFAFAPRGLIEGGGYT